MASLETRREAIAQDANIKDEKTSDRGLIVMTCVYIGSRGSSGTGLSEVQGEIREDK